MQSCRNSEWVRRLVVFDTVHVLRADQLYLMSERFELARPLEGSRASLEDDRAQINLRKDQKELVTHHSALQHRPAVAVHAVKLEHVPWRYRRRGSR